MAAYEAIITNESTGEKKVIKASSSYELDIKIENQNRKWFMEEEQRYQKMKKEQERLKAKAELDKKRDAIQGEKDKAVYDTEQALALIESYNNILQHTLDIDDKVDWDALKNHEAPAPLDFKEKKPEFIYGEPRPVLDTFLIELGVPEKSIFEFIFPWIRSKRHRLESKAERHWQLALESYDLRRQKAKIEHDNKILDYEQRLAAAISDHEEYVKAFKDEQTKHNTEVDSLKTQFESGNAEAIEGYVTIVLENSVYPDGYKKEFSVGFDCESKIVVIDYWLPTVNDLPNVTGYKYIASKRITEPVNMKPKDYDTLYDSVVQQICLRTIHEVYEAVYIPHVTSVVFNGWVRGIDKSNGQEFTSCIISCMASREEFNAINLRLVSPKDCIRALKGLIAGPLAQLAPVKPVLQINKEDSRFIESRDVLANINSTYNLAEMPWEDFEHLVRELFAKIFTQNGAEVRVTQASRDGGVDAIAFDPDPIRGGKFVIQAKRFNNVVSVSAVRDLYGTMISEGAVKGILVTTSYYGNDSREFIKDKPITLIDGSNLVHLFNEYGYEVRIDLKK